jgi:hypothetical protein
MIKDIQVMCNAYQVNCDGCGTEGPWSQHDPSDAVYDAMEGGWATDGTLSNYCPMCVKKLNPEADAM